MRWLRRLQIALFLLGAISFLAAIFFTGKQTGEDLWKAGVAFLLGDIALILLCPRKSP